MSFVKVGSAALASAAAARKKIFIVPDDAYNNTASSTITGILLMPHSPGDQLGPYVILAKIGAGGMGEVYSARDTKLGRQVAIKLLPGNLAANPMARERLRREAAAAAALDHPFICKVYEIAEEQDELFLVMEFVSGQTVFERLRAGQLPLPEALHIASEVAEALEVAHDGRFVHRDLKPANVMVAQGHVKVMDFGLAKRFDEPVARTSEDDATLTSGGPALTGANVVIGTPDYMSPEQVRGESLDQRSDMFPFGVLLCELLGSPHPFRRSSVTETMAAILRDAPDLRGNLPQGLMLLIRRLLAKSPGERYPTMREVRADLARVAAGSLAPESVKPPEERIPLIGREAERKELLQRMEEAMAGRGSIVMIGGEPGIGKTHLITAILEEARRRGAYTNIGHCYEMEGAPPYVPFIEMLENTARVAPREGFRRALGDAAPEIAKLMPELRNLYPDIPPAIQLPPEQQRRFLFNALREFLERAANGTPLVHVMEDLHWADEPTLLLLQHLAPMLASNRFLIIGTYRDVELEVTRPFAKSLEALLRQKQATRISLRRLGVDGVEEMLSALSGQTPPPSLARVVFAETEGNPFFVEEIFRHLAEEGKLFDETGKWRPGLRVDQLEVPEGVRLVLGRRLDRLGADARRILTTAAVIGRSFSLRLLEAMENQQADSALDAVEEAERAHLVGAEPAAGREVRYRFVHELVRQTLAESVSIPRRQRIHARVADAIEKVYSANLEAHVSALAHHLYQAGAVADADKTTKHLLAAARAARASAAHEDSLVHLENGLSLWEDQESPHIADLTEQRASALMSLRRWDEAAVDYRKAISLYKDAGAFTKAAQASGWLAIIYGWRCDFAGFTRVLNEALGLLPSVDSGLRLRLLSMRAAAHSAAGDVAGAVKSRAELELADDIWNLHFHVHSMQFPQAVQMAPRVEQVYRAAGDLWSAAEAAAHSLLRYSCGQPIEAARDIPGIMLQADKIGHYDASLLCRWASTIVAAANGDLRQAAREIEDAWNFGETHHLGFAFLTDQMRASIAYLRGDLKEAERWLRYRDEPLFHVSGGRASALFALLAESGDDRASEAWTQRRWELPIPGQLNRTGAWAALASSVVGLASMGRREEVAALRPLAEELVNTGVWVHRGLFPFRTVAGIAAACAGDWAGAEEHHLTAIHQMDTAPYRVSQPMAREWYARMLLDRSASGDAAKARGLLAEALAMYESMEMPFHAKRTRHTMEKQ